jgi:hypothetical protein
MLECPPMMKKLSSAALAICFAFSFLIVSADAKPQTSSGSSPKAAALNLYTVIKNQDWKALYYITIFSAKVRADLPDDADQFAAGIAKGVHDSDPDGVVDKLFKSISDITIGEPAMNGNSADVPTAANLTVNGKLVHFRGMAHMTKEKEVWKWDLSFTDDPQQATSVGIQTLFGKPDGQ